MSTDTPTPRAPDSPVATGLKSAITGSPLALAAYAFAQAKVVPPIVGGLAGADPEVLTLLGAGIPVVSASLALAAWSAAGTAARNVAAAARAGADEGGWKAKLAAFVGLIAP